MQHVAHRTSDEVAQLQRRVRELEALLREVQTQLECPARNTCRGRAYREGVIISNDVRDRIRAALAGKERHS